MIDVILRLLITAGLLTIPFTLLAFASGKAEGAIWLMIPFIAMLPALLVISLLFMPAEALATRFGLSANVTVTSLGCVMGAVVSGLAIHFGRNRTEVLRKLMSGDLTTLGAALGTVFVGGVVGAAWRLSARLLENWG